MAKIISKSQLNVGTELIIDEPNRTWELVQTGNLVFKDGSAGQALYSKFVELWNTASYQDSPFPMYAIDVLSGQFQFGTDGTYFNGWAPKNQNTINALRDIGFEQYDANGNLLSVHACFNGLGSINNGAQPYYHLQSSDAPANFPFTDQFNVPIKVFGNAANGNFDKRNYAKAFVREYAKKYKDSILADTGKTGTGAFKVDFLISNEDDLNVIANDAAMSGAPYTGITIAFYSTNQLRNIGGTNYPFRVIISGNGANKRQIYTKVQYLLRQAGDINVGGDAGVVTGKIASELMRFAGETVETTQGVFIDNFDANDTNDYIFRDQNNVARAFPFVSAGTLSFNAFLAGAGSSYRLFFKSPPGAANDWGEAGAVTVNDASGVPIAGTISSTNITFTFDYDGNTQAGFSASTNRDVILVGVRPGYGKVTIAEGLISRSKGIVISLVAEKDRAYLAA